MSMCHACIGSKMRLVGTPDIDARVIAIEKITAGEALLQFSGNILAWDDIEYDSYEDRHCLCIAPGIYLGPSGGLDDYINHSCDPNCEVTSDLQLVALRDIVPDEEITYDYIAAEHGLDSDYEMVCTCGALNCRAKIGTRRPER